jgi:hypothetical protein
MSCQKRKLEESDTKDEKGKRVTLKVNTGAYSAFARRLAYKSSYGEPSSRKEAAESLRGVLPARSFPLEVMDVVLEFMQRDLLCGPLPT